eukprot:11157949-Lingulodinium_polyedra.AAC.1
MQLNGNDATGKRLQTLAQPRTLATRRRYQRWARGPAISAKKPRCGSVLVCSATNVRVTWLNDRLALRALAE